MTNLSKSAFVVAALLAATPAFAQDAHHPATPGQATSAAPTKAKMPKGQPAMPGMSPGGMMQMMEMMMGRGDMMGAMMQRGGMMMPMPAMMGMADHADGWLAFLKTELKITDAQTVQWDKFSEAVHANSKAMAEQRASMMQPSSMASSLPSRLAARETALAGQLEAVQRLKTATDPLYAALSDDQKKTFDELTASPGGMM